MNSSELPLTAPPMTAMTAMTIVASEASSRIASRIAIAAVGRKNGSVGRPAVTLSASVAPTTSSPIRISTLSRCQSPGRKRQIQASSIPTTSTASRSQPPKLATSGTGSRSRRASIFSMSVAVELRPVADDDLALADRDVDRRDVGRGLGLRGIGEVGAERRVRDDERADQFGGEHPFRVAQITRHQTGQLTASDGDLGIA